MALDDVVVVIPNLNGAAVLSATLAAIPAAAGGLGYRVVMVDNASSDASVELVQRRHPEVAVLRHAENRGFAAACNAGGRSLPGRYVLLLNSDVTLAPRSLEALVALMDREPRLGALTPRMCWPDGRLQGPRLAPWARARELARMDWVPGTCLLLRREALDQVGWLDEDFFFYNEDLDLSWRLRKAGWQLACAPDIRVHHHEGAATRSDPAVRARAMAEGYRGSYLLARKHYPWAAELVRWGLRVELWWRGRELGRKVAAGLPLTEREQALQLALAAARAMLGGRA